MRVIVDRIEGNKLVVELPGKQTATMDKALLPEAKEGDIVNILVDVKETEKRTMEIKNKMKNIFND
ncbi:MAG: DUF3006 domain-containing protein [Bacillota bacterium]|nr:DUF3006 domain-containing protein [Bacillota bacterium]